MSSQYKHTAKVSTKTYKYLTNYSDLGNTVKAKVDKDIKEGKLYKTKADAEKQRDKDLATLKKQRENAVTTMKIIPVNTPIEYIKPATLTYSLKANNKDFKYIEVKRPGTFKKLLNKDSKYALNTNSRVIHKGNCIYVKMASWKDIKESKDTLTILKMKGYKKCSHCLK